MEKVLLNKQVDSSSRSDQASTSGGGPKRRKYRKYNDCYLDFGFTSVEVNNEERPQCVLCSKILAPDSMLPSKLATSPDNSPYHGWKIGRIFQ
jgi:hypothetical protein